MKEKARDKKRGQKTKRFVLLRMIVRPEQRQTKTSNMSLDGASVCKAPKWSNI